MPDAIGGSSLPPVTVRVNVDDKQLDKAGVTGDAAGKKIAASLGQATAATKTHTTATKHLAEGHEHASEAALKNAKALGEVGKGGAEAFEKVKGLSGALGGLAGGGAMGAGLIAGGALLAVGKFALEAAKGYQELTEKTHDYMRVTGESAEEGSRQVQMFERFGVSEEAASKGMFKFENAIEKTPAKIAQLGITVARTANGNVDMKQTLYNLADAYVHEGDASQKAAILMNTFGKSGRDMIPVLEQGSEGIKKMESEISLVLTDKDIEQVHKYALQQKELKQNWTNITNTIGQQVVPVLSNLTGKMNEESYVTKRLDQYGKDHNWTLIQSIQKHSDLEDKFQKEYTAGEQAKQGMEALTSAQQDETAATAAQSKAIMELNTETMKTIGASLGFEGSIIAKTRALDAYKKADDDATKADSTYAAGSKARHDADLAKQEASLGLVKSLIDVAKNQSDLIAQQEGLGKSDEDQAKKADIFREALRKQASELQPGTGVRQELEGYIAQLDAIPHTKTTQIVLSVQQQAMDQLVHFLDSEHTVTVRPTVVAPTGGGSGVDPTQYGGAATPTVGAGPSISVVQNGTNFSPVQTAREIAWLQKTAG